MKHRRRFSIELKRQVVEELLSGVSTPAQLTRRHEISSGLLYHWKEQYARGRFDNEPSKEAALEDRVRQLEQLVGRLTLENEFLKKAVQRGLLSQPKKSAGSLPKNESRDNPHLITGRSKGKIQSLIFQDHSYSGLAACTYKALLST